MKKIVIFASGTGTNAENIIRYFEKHPQISVKALFCNKKEALVLDKIKPYNISAFSFNKTAFFKDDYVLKLLEAISPDLIVLAGFLWKITNNIVRVFDEKIINIHPSLLPKYGGEGMYGERIHREVIQNGDAKSGITIHYVNENYDEGNVIFQTEIPVRHNDTINSLAQSIHELEYEHFPKQIEKLLA